MYYIDFGLDRLNKTVEGTLEDAKKEAENSAEFTVSSIRIYEGSPEEWKERQEPVAVLPWYGRYASEYDEVVVDFGSLGYYGAWRCRKHPNE